MMMDKKSNLVEEVEEKGERPLGDVAKLHNKLQVSDQTLADVEEHPNYRMETDKMSWTKADTGASKKPPTRPLYTDRGRVGRTEIKEGHRRWVTKTAKNLKAAGFNGTQVAVEEAHVVDPTGWESLGILQTERDGHFVMVKDKFKKL
ncbi:hypothetical protein RUM44_000319 [Polyplax serrata]|uniref:Uncharacterized protein n=1 Tax=Polyplax serrata TaxID=468196 RepID=A0ABR1B5T9_POLSC